MENNELELEKAKGELARLRQEKETLSQELAARDGSISDLKSKLASRESEITLLNQSVAESEKKHADLSGALGKAVTSYKTLVAQAHPDVPAELISGDSVEVIEQSLEQARSLVSKVRQGVEAEIARTRVPLGAPPRTEPDLSALSAREKIQYGIGGKN